MHHTSRESDWFTCAGMTPAVIRSSNGPYTAAVNRSSNAPRTAAVMDIHIDHNSSNGCGVRARTV
jgi:hypothetical protein